MKTLVTWAAIRSPLACHASLCSTRRKIPRTVFSGNAFRTKAGSGRSPGSVVCQASDGVAGTRSLPQPGDAWLGCRAGVGNVISISEPHSGHRNRQPLVTGDFSSSNRTSGLIGHLLASVRPAPIAGRTSSPLAATGRTPRLGRHVVAATLEDHLGGVTQAGA